MRARVSVRVGVSPIGVAAPLAARARALVPVRTRCVGGTACVWCGAAPLVRVGLLLGEVCAHWLKTGQLP